MDYWLSAAHRLSEQHPLAAAIVACALAAGLTFILSLAVGGICARTGVLDRPEPRRVHRIPVPRLGGIAIFLSFALVSLLFFVPSGAYELRVYAGLMVAAIIIVSVMAIDDIRGLPPLFRLAVQIVAALIAMFPGGHGTLIEVIHNPLVTTHAGHTFLPLAVAVPFTLFWIVGMMNTVNWMDGMDGLAGGVVAITALVMAAISWMLGQQSAAILCAVLAGATLGFLPLNWHPARIFMGDSGAMFLGLALAVLANVGGAKLAMMLMLLGLPILDAARVILRRIREGRSILGFDRTHVHHGLLARGFGQRQIALIFYTITAAFGGVTILGAYLQRQATQWHLHTKLVPWLDVTSSELPTLLGLASVLVVSILLWRVAARRKNRRATRPLQGLSTASGSHPRP